MPQTNTQTPASAILYAPDEDGRLAIDLCGPAFEDESSVLAAVMGEIDESADDLLRRHGFVRETPWASIHDGLGTHEATIRPRFS